MPRLIGKVFKTYEGALKRARFENTHKDHLKNPEKTYHIVAGSKQNYRVVRVRQS